IAGQRALLAAFPPAEAEPEAAPALRVRMALHSGYVEQVEGEYRGLALHHASRVLAAGYGGQVLCSEATAALLRCDLGVRAQLRDLGAYRLRGVETPARLFQVEYPD